MRGVTSSVRRSIAAAVLLSLVLTEAAFAIERERRERTLRQRVKTLIVRVLDMLGTPPG